jgi:hypothetical protein
MILCVLLLSPLWIPAASAAETPQAVLDAAKSVVRIYTVDADDGEAWIGSGFILGHDDTYAYVATNLHCVSNLGEISFIDDLVINRSSSYVLTVNMLTNVLHVKDIMVPSTTLDLAVLKIEGLTDRPALRLGDPESVNQGDACYVLGFPGAADQMRDDTYDAPSTVSDVNITDGSISQKGAEIAGQISFQHTAYQNHGNSGGPLLNEAGEVIGVNTYGMDGVSRSIYIDYITKFCADAGIPLTAEEDLAAEPEDPTDPADPADPAGPDAAETTEETQEEDTGFVGWLKKWWVYVAIGAGVVVIGVVLTIVLVLRNSKKAAAPVPSPSYAQQVPVGAAVTKPSYAQAPQPRLTGIRGTGGQFNTTSFPVSDRIAVGRDPARCAVIFQPQTAGVSSLHCEIIRQGDVLQLVDRGSSYGTFLESGQKLSANVPVSLNAGQGFYLGDKRNSFTVY